MSTSCGKLIFHYFNDRGRGETIRYVLSLGKADWEDKRYALEEAPKIRQSQDFPLGQLPVLEWTDKEGKTHKLTQAATILRAVSCWFGLAGKTPCECSQVDEAYEVLREIREVAFLIYLEKDPERKAKLVEKMKGEVIPRNFEYLEKNLQQRGGMYLAGGEWYTYADLALAAMSVSMRRQQAYNEEHAKTHWPGLHALIKRVEELPEIKAYIDKRPDTEH